jgi:hypothetical protein
MVRASNARTRGEHRPMSADPNVSLLRPLLWIAGLAFATGFCGYLAIGLSVAGGATAP